MKVLLLQQVPNVGDKFDVADVADGYGRNYLIPQGYAKLATEAEVEQIAQQKEREAQERAEREAQMAQELEKVHGTNVELSAGANEEGSLYAGLHADDIIGAINEKTGLDLSTDHIDVEEPIKETGEYTVKVSVGESTAQITVTVTAS